MIYSLSAHQCQEILGISVGNPTRQSTDFISRHFSESRNSSCACFSQCERWMRSDQVTVWLDYHGFFVEKTDILNLEEISMCKKSPSLIHCLISYGNVIYYHKHNEICSCFTFLYVSPCSSTQRGHT